MPPKVKQSRLVGILLRTLFVSVVFVIALIDLSMGQMVETSDFAATFYVPGKLMASGRLAELYPSPNDTRLADTAYNKAAHSILPHLPDTTGTAFSYPPLVALLVSPLTIFPPALSLLVFQFLSLSALILSAFLITGRTIEKAERGLLAAFLFVPVIIVLWIGQLDVVAGILPYACMYHFLRKDKPLPAGLVASLSFLKPQLGLAPVIVALAYLCRRQWKVFAGLALGALLLASTFAAWGPEIGKGWMAAVKLQESDFLSPTAGVPRHLAMSVPRLLLFMLPSTQVAAARPIIYGLAAAVLLAALFACHKLAKAVKDDVLVLNITFVVACLMLPIVAPHLFYYDLSILAVAGWLSFSHSAPATNWNAFIKPRAIILWIIISIYPIAFVFSKSMFLPLIVLIPLVAIFADILFFIWHRASSLEK